VNSYQFDRSKFEVEIASTGRRVSITANRNVIDVLADHGIEIPWSYGVGICGTYRTGVLAGVPDHWDSVLQPANGAMFSSLVVHAPRPRSWCSTVEVCRAQALSF
jgi:vanillate O-demethylase ferredoxin subunit